MNNERIYKVAYYLRVSKEDLQEKDESSSIYNQRLILDNYIKEVNSISNVEFVKINEYIDDGFSGTNFKRPAFKKMLKDIDNKIIDCIIVKDLSRFGRDYLAVGTYIEVLFSSMNVRVISVNDNYDSYNKNNSDVHVIAFTNYINTLYAEEISKKVKRTFETKRLNKEYVAATCPYGYIKTKDFEGKTILEIDDVTAPIVKEIFSLRLNGLSTINIANLLNERNIPSPSSIKASRKGKIINTKWIYQNVQRILDNEIYIGIVSLGKYRTIDYRIKKIITVEKSEQVQLKDRAPAIIDVDDFELARKLKYMPTYSANNCESIFSGLLFCADCSQNLIKKSTKNKSGIHYWYGCSSKLTNNGCTMHKIMHSDLYEKVKRAIQNHIEKIIEKKDLIHKFFYKQTKDDIYCTKILEDINWVNMFISYKDCDLSRIMVLRLIERIDIYEDDEIEINFRFSKEFDELSKDIEENM